MVGCCGRDCRTAEFDGYELLGEAPAEHGTNAGHGAERKALLKADPRSEEYKREKRGFDSRLLHLEKARIDGRYEKSQ